MARTRGTGLLMLWTDMRHDAGSPAVFRRIRPDPVP
jgi:hypothetical protein